MAYFLWQDSYSVGVPSIDQQHKKLVGMLNELFDAMQKGRGKQILNNVLDELIEYTATHFREEEEAMKRANYSGFAEHKAKHDAMTKKVLELQQRVRDGSKSVTVEVSDFLRGWLQKHILETDMKYKDAMKDAGIY